MLSIGPRFAEVVKAVSGNGIPWTSSPGLVVIPAKGFGKMLPIGTRFTDACCGVHGISRTVSVKEFGKMLLIGTRFTEAVAAKNSGNVLLIGTRFTENSVSPFS